MVGICGRWMSGGQPGCAAASPRFPLGDALRADLLRPACLPWVAGFPAAAPLRAWLWWLALGFLGVGASPAAFRLRALVLCSPSSYVTEPRRPEGPLRWRIVGVWVVAGSVNGFPGGGWVVYCWRLSKRMAWVAWPGPEYMGWAWAELRHRWFDLVRLRAAS